MIRSDMGDLMFFRRSLLLAALLAMIGSLVGGMYVIVQIVSGA